MLGEGKRMIARSTWLITTILALPNLLGGYPAVPGYERLYKGKVTPIGGAVLYSELGCANCHRKETNIPQRSGPKLQNLPRRLYRDWVRRFLLDPDGTTPGTTMPDVLAGLPEEGRGQAAEDLLAWLQTLPSRGGFSPPRHGNASNGEALFKANGCVVCHVDSEKLPDLASKTSFAALGGFLLQTDTYRPDGRMPHFKLNIQDAWDITAYLMDFEGSDPRLTKAIPPWPKVSQEAVARGKALAGKLQCANCHDVPGLEPHPKAPIQKMSYKSFPSHPRYKLTGNQHTSIQEFLQLKQPLEGAEATLAALNCYACHSRDGKGGPDNNTDGSFTGDLSLGEPGRIPPPLTDAGHKLQPAWMEKVFRGEKHVRPYLRTQMPVYKAHANLLTQILQDADRRPPNRFASGKPDLQAGYKLLGSLGGYNCITCHDWGAKKSLGIRGLDLQTSGDRLRKEWFRDYLFNPAAYRPGTLMPNFWPGGKASIQDVLDGTPGRQINAIWAAVQSKEGEPPGFPAHAPREYELLPGDRPIIQRAFFKGVGTNAILVGFPGGLNLGYDSATAQPKLLWKGRFMDAYNTWFVRKFPFEVPLGKNVIHFPQAPAGEYLGYQIEGDGSPTFLSVGYMETYKALDGKLLRIVSPQDARVGHPAGVDVKSSINGREATYTYSF